MNHFVGIDLASSTKNESAFCIINSKRRIITLKTFHSESELLESLPDKVIVAAIDSPLTIPLGLNGNFGIRQCEKELMSSGIKVFPTTFLSTLLFRAINLKKKLRRLIPTMKIIETFPNAVYHSAGLNSVKRGKQRLTAINEFLSSILSGFSSSSKHESDAATCSLTALTFHIRSFKEFGNKKEGTIILPDERFFKNK